MANLEDAAHFLRGADKILILSHRSPDGDTLGCASALSRALIALGKSVMFRCADPVPPKFTYLFEGIEYGEFEPEHIVTVDVADKTLLGSLEPYGDKTDFAIDHQASCRPFAKETWVEGTAGAACELIARLIPALGAEITPKIADCLYTGIATDSGCFKYSNTSPQTHVYAAELMKLGADIVPINYAMFDMKSQGRLKLEQLALSKIRYYSSGRIAVIDVTQSLIDSIDGIDSEDVGALSAIPRQIEGVDIGICIKEKNPGFYKVSLRSSENADVAAIAQQFGGGGHARAAGCAFETSLEDAEKQIVWACAKALGNAT